MFSNNNVSLCRTGANDPFAQSFRQVSTFTFNITSAGIQYNYNLPLRANCVYQLNNYTHTHYTVAQKIQGLYSTDATQIAIEYCTHTHRFTFTLTFTALKEEIWNTIRPRAKTEMIARNQKKNIHKGIVTDSWNDSMQKKIIRNKNFAHVAKSQLEIVCSPLHATWPNADWFIQGQALRGFYVVRVLLTTSETLQGRSGNKKSKTILPRHMQQEITSADLPSSSRLYHAANTLVRL